MFGKLYPFRRTVLDGKFPRALYRHDLRQLFLYGLNSSIAAGVKDQSRSSDGDPTFGGSPVVGVGGVGRYVDFPTGAYHTLGSGFNTSNWSEGTFAIILNNQQLGSLDPIAGDRSLTDNSTRTIVFEISAIEVLVFKKTAPGPVTETIGKSMPNNTGVWRLYVFDFGPRGMRIFADGRLVQTGGLATGTRIVGSPAAWMINRYGDAPIVYGDKHVKLFAAWKRQVGDDVSHRLWRAYGRAA